MLRGQGRGWWVAPLLGVALLLGGCDAGTSDPRRPATERAARRAYDGAPPVAPHRDFGVTCTECHNERGLQIDGVGYAPPTPHEGTTGLSATSRCRQCHVFRATEQVWVDSTFVGLVQDLARGQRLNELAPPTIPHPVFMRENCRACHTGPAAREEIRTSHPERARCTQCHVPTTSTGTFAPASEAPFSEPR